MINSLRYIETDVKKFLLIWISSIVVMIIIILNIPQPINNGEVQIIKKNTIKMVELGEYTITAYCSCEICCGQWAKNRPNGIVYGARGTELIPGKSIAMPNFEFGTRVYIEDLGIFIVDDRPAQWICEKYNNKIIDIYFNNHQDALNFGVLNKKVYLLKKEEIE